jgi:ABC-type lipopolysaccharide export system ATPase subunit
LKSKCSGYRISVAATRVNKREVTERELELSELQMTDLEKVNAAAAVKVERRNIEISQQLAVKENVLV